MPSVTVAVATAVLSQAAKERYNYSKGKGNVQLQRWTNSRRNQLTVTLTRFPIRDNISTNASIVNFSTL